MLLGTGRGERGLLPSSLQLSVLLFLRRGGNRLLLLLLHLPHPQSPREEPHPAEGEIPEHPRGEAGHRQQQEEHVKVEERREGEVLLGDKKRKRNKT